MFLRISASKTDSTGYFSCIPNTVEPQVTRILTCKKWTLNTLNVLEVKLLIFQYKSVLVHIWYLNISKCGCKPPTSCVIAVVRTKTFSCILFVFFSFRNLAVKISLKGRTWQPLNGKRRWVLINKGKEQESFKYMMKSTVATLLKSKGPLRELMWQQAWKSNISHLRQ